MPIEINQSETRGPNADAFLSERPKHPCFIPICMYSFMSNRPFLREYLSWAVSKCDRSRIVIGDHLERHNIMVFEGLPETEASTKAEQRGKRIIRDIRAILDDLGTDHNAEVLSCRKITETDVGKQITSVIRDFALKSESFEADVNNQIGLMISNTRRQSADHIDNALGPDMVRLREYMIEEIALFLSLYRDGYTTEIYPGRDMSIFRKMAAGEYPDFPYDFSERTHISVSVLLDSGTSYARLDDSNGEGDFVV